MRQRALWSAAPWMVLVLAPGLAAGCRNPAEVPPPGDVLLRVALGAGAETPEELRVSAYDDTGTLWSDVRFPDQGALVPRSTTQLGTILVQPGTTVGALRLDVRGLVDGAPVEEATLSIAPEALAGTTFSVTLLAALPADSDGDGVPDPIDDCPAVADPKQSGCPKPDSGAPGGHDAGRDAGQTRAGVSCNSARDCPDGFCKDGVCCNSACNAPCESCTTGTCLPVKNAQDVPECSLLLTCDTGGNCVLDLSGAGN